MAATPKKLSSDNTGANRRSVKKLAGLSNRPAESLSPCLPQGQMVVYAAPESRVAVPGSRGADDASINLL